MSSFVDGSSVIPALSKFQKSANDTSFSSPKSMLLVSSNTTIPYAPFLNLLSFRGDLPEITIPSFVFTANSLSLIYFGISVTISQK